MKHPWWRRAAEFVAALPFWLRVVLLVAAVLHGVGISWGLPASDAWDNDGVAPRDFLPGLADTYSPGHFYTYPPLHLALLAVLTLPVLLLAIARADAPTVKSVLGVILGAPYMTTMALVARATSLLMSLGIIVTLALVAAELVPPARRRGVMVGTGAFAAVNVSFDYYAHMTNLDVPYLFWALLGTLALVRAIVRCEPRRLRGLAIFGALAITTKDQAYAMLLLGAPVALLAWVALDARVRTRANLRALALEAALGVVIAAVIIAVVDGAVTNPTGFRARVQFLTGSASQDYATYSRDAAGRLLVLVDVVRAWTSHYPAPLAVLFGIGLVDTLVAARREGRGTLVAALVPLALAASFTVCFNLVARRVEERFTLPQMLLAAVYAGVGVERLWSGLPGPAARWAGRAAVVGLLGLSAWRCIVIDANLLLEPRYEVEAWLAGHAAPGQTIEVHGLNVYIPRFRPGEHVIRVGPAPPQRRSPLPEVVEVQDALTNIGARKSHFIVVSHCYAWRYLKRDVRGDSGHVVPPVQRGEHDDPDPTTFFQDLWEGKLPYHLALEARVRSRIFPRAELHASLGCPVDVYERNEGAP
ncbi:MAG: hypothetical protein JWP97_3740 [Labilithrix sp.]|nr:hypothetical protein [Labilithrix sp.]